MIDTTEDMTRGIVCTGINTKYQICIKWDCEVSNSISEKKTKQNYNFTSWQREECKKIEESRKHLGIITHLSEILERKVERRKSSPRDTKYALFKM